MESILFCVMHHSTCSFHTEVFDKCISSIKKFHPNNKILVCYTSTSVIPQHMLEYTNVTYQLTPIDGTHVYGAMSILTKLNDVDNYILLHDSMILLKPISDSVLNKRFYFLWYFQALYHQHYDKVIQLICNTKFDYKSKCELLDKYHNQTNSTWIGLFGPAFGGKIEILKKLWNMLNIDDSNLVNYVGKDQIMMAERYIPLIATYMEIVDIFPNVISLNDSIEKQPYKFIRSENINNVNQVINAPYNSYMCKIWLMRP